ncbi:MAG: hypothetical protein J5829_06050 [Lachnospiraceae bacterium]|nr:hypothetical protein [Lachnospiraceae bacterium]
MSNILEIPRVTGRDGNIRYVVESEETEYIPGYRRGIEFTWDTGAFISSLSVSNFIKDSDSEEYKLMVKSIDDDSEYIEYNSVSGSGKGVLRKIKTLQIGNLLIEDFYFLLVKDVKRIIGNRDYLASTCLLGSDFIDCCKFEHDVESDIIVTGFDINKYTEHHSVHRYKNREMVFKDLFAVDAN